MLLAFYVFKRSKRAASITFAIFVILGTMGQVNEAVTNFTANTGEPHRTATPYEPGG
jgi:hypothetical protein